jgi:hypothetical protein
MTSQTTGVETGRPAAYRRELASRLLLIVASAAIVLVGLELPALTGYLDYRTLIGPSHVWWAPNIPDPELVHRHRPYAHQRGAARGGDISQAFQIPSSELTTFQWDVRYDRNGFRNQSDLDRADIAVPGDSFVEGLTVPANQLATSLLAGLEGNTVANLGQSAWGPQQELVVLKRYALPLHPRTVLWLFFEGNDLGDAIGYRHEAAAVTTFWESFRARSFTRSARGELKQLLHPRVKSPGVQRSGILDRPGQKPLPVYFIYPAHALTPQEAGALEETRSILKEAYQLSAKQGAQLVVVYVPDKFRVFSPFMHIPPESACRHWVLSDLPERFQKEVRSISSDVGYLDLTGSLQDAVKQGIIPYYPDDAHWSEAGHRVASQTIDQYLRSTGEP